MHCTETTTLCVDQAIINYGRHTFDLIVRPQPSRAQYESLEKLVLPLM